MRISDWSSDVCSSDLPQRRDLAQRRGQSREIVLARKFDRAPRCEVIGLKLAIEQREAAVFEASDQPGERDLRGVGLPAQDRKRVVSGKSGAVRVELGGRRILKNKKKQTMSTRLTKK